MARTPSKRIVARRQRDEKEGGSAAQRTPLHAQTEELNLYLLCWYGATLELRIYQRGQLTRTIDVHRYVTVSIDGHEPITFSGPGKPVGYDFKSEPDDDDSLAMKLFRGDLEDATEVQVAWDRMEVPKLEKPVATKKDVVTLDGDWLEDEEEIDEEELLDEEWLRYGYTDTED